MSTDAPDVILFTMTGDGEKGRLTDSDLTGIGGVEALDMPNIDGSGERDGVKEKVVEYTSRKSTQSA